MTRWDNDEPATESERTREWIEHHLDQVHGPFLARVQAYNTSLQVADVVPLVRHAVRDPDGGYTHEDLPVIPCCPVAWPGAAGHFSAFSLRPGDIVVCLTMTSAYGHWWAGDGSVQDPGDLRRNHIANSIVLPLNVRRRGAPLRHVPQHDSLEEPRIVAGSDDPAGTRLTLLANGTLRVSRGTNTVVEGVEQDDAVRLEITPNGTVHAGRPSATKPLAVAELVTALAQSLKDHIAGWTPAAGDGGAALKLHMATWSPPSVAATKTRGV